MGIGPKILGKSRNSMLILMDTQESQVWRRRIQKNQPGLTKDVPIQTEKKVKNCFWPRRNQFL
jgi:hypothetical protein